MKSNMNQIETKQKSKRNVRNQVGLIEIKQKLPKSNSTHIEIKQKSHRNVRHQIEIKQKSYINQIEIN